MVFPVGRQACPAPGARAGGRGRVAVSLDVRTGEGRHFTNPGGGAANESAPAVRSASMTRGLRRQPMSERIPMTETLSGLLAQVRACRHCADLPLGPNPVLRVDSRARILVIGQAPGTRVHATGIPWNDPSGDRLGFCYPGKGKSGDLPPPPACAPLWHDRLLAHLPAVDLVLLIGQYAQRHYMAKQGLGPFHSLTATVRNGPVGEGRYMPLVHPSPRNQLWLKRNPWFDAEVVPLLRERVAHLLAD